MKRYIYIIVAITIAIPVFGAEVRKWGANDISYVDFTSPAGKSVTGVQPVNLKQALGTVDASSMQTAVDCTVMKGRLFYFPPGTYTFNGTVTLPNWPVRITGDNAIINQTGSAPTFLQNNHVYTEISGIRFTGNGNGFKFNATPTATMYRDFLIDRCQFSTDAGVYGVYLYGPRSGYISNSLFEGAGNGIYLQSVCVPFVVDTTFKGTDYTANGIIYDGDGLGTSCGIGVRDTEILGYDNGLIIRYADWGNITGSTIDYNNNSIRLESTESVSIQGGNYIGSVGDNPAIWIGQGEGAVGTPDYTAHTIIANSTITGHKETGTDYSAIRITEGSVNVKIIGNNIQFYNAYGIWADNTTFLNIFANYFAERSGLGLYSIYRTGAISDVSWNIANNIFGTSQKAISGMTFAWIRDNYNFYNDWESGTVVNGVVTVDVNHNLDVTPDFVTLTPNENHPVWVTNITSTQFTINTDNAAYSPFIVYWHARKLRGQ